SLQWRKDGADLTGATNNTYSINAVGTNDAGSYSVLASDAFGSDVSSNLVISVVLGPINDDFDNRLPIPAFTDSVTVKGNNFGSGLEQWEASLLQNSGLGRYSKSLWWTWTAPPENVDVNLDTSQSGNYVYPVVYTGNTISNLVVAAPLYVHYLSQLT